MLTDLRKQIKGLKIKIDPDTNLSPKMPITFQGEQVRLAGLLDKVCTANRPRLHRRHGRK